MLRRRMPDEPRQDELPMTPMIDVIFQLVIFFMCSMHFKELEGKLQTYLPKYGHGPGPDTLISEVRLFLRMEGPLVSAKLEGRASASFPADPAKLVGVSSAWDRLGRDAGGIWRGLAQSDPRACVKIDAGGDVPFQYVVSALDSCRRAGVTNIDFAASARVHETLRGTTR